MEGIQITHYFIKLDKLKPILSINCRNRSTLIPLKQPSRLPQPPPLPIPLLPYFLLIRPDNFGHVSSDYRLLQKNQTSLEVHGVLTGALNKVWIKCVAVNF